MRSSSSAALIGSLRLFLTKSIRIFRQGSKTIFKSSFFLVWWGIQFDCILPLWSELSLTDFQVGSEVTELLHSIPMTPWLMKLWVKSASSYSNSSLDWLTFLARAKHWGTLFISSYSFTRLSYSQRIGNLIVSLISKWAMEFLNKTRINYQQKSLTRSRWSTNQYVLGAYSYRRAPFDECLIDPGRTLLDGNVMVKSYQVDKSQHFHIFVPVFLLETVLVVCWRSIPS